LAAVPNLADLTKSKALAKKSCKIKNNTLVMELIFIKTKWQFSIEENEINWVTR
jgi:UPF0176 protein